MLRCDDLMRIWAWIFNIYTENVKYVWLNYYLYNFYLLIFVGANIQSVRDKTGARIIFPSEKDKDREVITILGTKESVAQAKKELESRIKDLVSTQHSR